MRRRRLLGRPSAGMGWLYLVSDGKSIKVGRTINPDGRVRNHFGAAEWRHYFGYGSRAFTVSAELACMRALRHAGKPVHHGLQCEKFTGLTRERAIEVARAAVLWARGHVEAIEERSARRHSESGAWKQFRAGLLQLAEEGQAPMPSSLAAFAGAVTQNRPLFISTAATV